MVFIQRLLCRLQASVFPCPQLTGIDQDILFLLVFRNQRAAVMIPRQILKRVRIGGEMKLRMEYDVSAVVKNIPRCVWKSMILLFMSKMPLSSIVSYTGQPVKRPRPRWTRRTGASADHSAAFNRAWAILHAPIAASSRAMSTSTLSYFSVNSS